MKVYWYTLQKTVYKNPGSAYYIHKRSPRGLLEASVPKSWSSGKIVLS